MPSTVCTTTIEFGKLRIPVKVIKGTQKQEPTLDRRVKSKGEFHPVGNVEVNKATGRKIARTSVVRGVETDTGFAPISQRDIEEIERQTDIEGLHLDAFVPVAEIPWERVRDTYFLLPDGVGAKGLAILARALQVTGRAAVGKIVLRKRQKLVVLYPEHGGLVAVVLAYAAEFRDLMSGAADLSDVEVPDAAVALAAELVTTAAAPGSVLNAYEDDLVVMKRGLIQDAVMGRLERKPEVERREPEAVPPDRLIAALEESLREVSVAV